MQQGSGGPAATNKRHRPPELVRADAELRRRDKTSKITAPIQIMLLAGLLCVGGALSLTVRKPVWSDYENRELAKKPDFSLESLLRGTYTRQLESYYADTFPLRETLVKAAGRVTECYGVRGGEGRIHMVADAGGTQPASPPEPPPAASGAPPAQKDSPQDASSAPQNTPETDAAASPEEEELNLSKLSPVFVYRGDALSIFGAGSNAPADYYAQQLNSWQAAMGEETTIYNLVVPTHIEFALPEKHRDISAPQKPNIDYIYSQLKPPIKPVDAWSKLNEHKDEYLYFHTDHHWTGLGAYYAYTAFCETAGLAPVPLDRMEKRTIENYIGSLYAQTQDSALLQNPDHVDYWVMPTPCQVTQLHRGNPFYFAPASLLAEQAASYSVFLGGDYPLTKITTELHNGRKIAVVKESFGNAFAPFLVNHYEEVYVVDQRYFELNLPAFLRENGVQELLFINNIFAANTYVRMNEIARLRTQVYRPPEPEPEPEETSSEETSSEESSESSSESSKPRARKRKVPSSSSSSSRSWRDE